MDTYIFVTIFHSTPIFVNLYWTFETYRKFSRPGLLTTDS